MGGEPQRVGEREEGALALAAQILAVGAVPRSHEGGAEGFPLVLPLAGVGEAQGMAQLVGDTTDEDRVVTADRDVPILAVVEHGLLFREEVQIQQWGVHLPGGALHVGSPGVVGAVLGHGFLFRIPVRHVAEDDDGFLVRIHPGHLQRLETFLADLAAAFRGIVGVGMIAPHLMDADLATRLLVESQRAWTEADPCHFPCVEFPDVVQHGGEPLAVSRRGFTVGRRPQDHVQFPLCRHRFLRLPFVQNGSRRRDLRGDVRLWCRGTDQRGDQEKTG